tara:strand:+ start:382 stop:639 length:258 start_codon:yes stop_codon:yes gene_type:complete
MLLPVERLSRNTESMGLDESESRSLVDVNLRKTRREIPSDAIAVKNTQIVKFNKATTISAFMVDTAPDIKQIRTRGARLRTIFNT